jgi:hypothetical protein
VNTNTWETLMDDNPGRFSRAINRTYPNKRPLSSVPVNLLARLPPLPDDIEYRFLGRDLILLDTRASVILDRIPSAIQCVQSDKFTCKGQSAAEAKPHAAPQRSVAHRR